jgi:predicted Zn-dependent peptidase
MDYQIFTLKNGIRVIHQEVDSPVAHFGVIVNTGSRDEEATEQGMAHFIEHTIFKGTQKRKAFQIINRLEDVGGELNAYTTKEETAIYATFLEEFYPRAIELMSDILINATFPAKELELEKEVIIEEINSYNDSPSELIFDEFEELIYHGHPIARNILGTPDLVRSFDKPMIERFMHRNYHTNEMVICSVGKLSPQRFIKLIHAHFDAVPENLSERNRLGFSTYTAQKKEVEKNTYQSHCIIGGEAYSLINPLRLPMILMNNILGGSSMNSRLNMALRERNGMAYNVEANYTPYTDTGVFMVYFGTDRANLAKAAAIVEREFKLMRDKKMGAVQLMKAKKQLIGQLAVSSENREDLMLNLGRSLLYFDKVDTMKSVFEKIESITPDEIFQVANEMLDRDRLSQLIFY